MATGAATPDGIQGTHTNHFVVSDRWGNIVSYTNTIEQLGGSGIVVPGRGFLLNNELTDFNFAPTQGAAPDPNLAEPGKRPRSSMSPTIVLKHGKPFFAVGSPGGSTIITTVLQIIVNRLDLGMTLEEAIAAPRATQRNTPATLAEQGFISAVGEPLVAIGHKFDVSTGIGVAAGLEFTRGGKVIAVGEPVRRGGTSAAVVHPPAPLDGHQAPPEWSSCTTGLVIMATRMMTIPGAHDDQSDGQQGSDRQVLVAGEDQDAHALAVGGRDGRGADAGFL